MHVHLIEAHFGRVANVPDEVEAHVLRGRAAHPCRGIGAALAHVQATQRYRGGRAYTRATVFWTHGWMDGWMDDGGGVVCVWMSEKCSSE